MLQSSPTPPGNIAAEIRAAIQTVLARHVTSDYPEGLELIGCVKGHLRHKDQPQTAIGFHMRLEPEHPESLPAWIFQ